MMKNLNQQRASFHKPNYSEGNPSNNRKPTFFYRLSRVILLSMICTFVYPTTQAHQIDISVLPMGHYFNVGLEWDFRSLKRENGFSFITKAIYARILDINVAMLGAGTRYRYFFNNHFSGDVNALAMLVYVPQPHSSGVFALSPQMLLGVNYHFENDMALGINFLSVSGQGIALIPNIRFSFPILI